MLGNLKLNRSMFSKHEKQNIYNYLGMLDDWQQTVDGKDIDAIPVSVSGNDLRFKLFYKYCIL